MTIQLTIGMWTLLLIVTTLHLTRGEVDQDKGLSRVPPSGGLGKQIMRLRFQRRVSPKFGHNFVGKRSSGQQSFFSSAYLPVGTRNARFTHSFVGKREVDNALRELWEGRKLEDASEPDISVEERAARAFSHSFVGKRLGDDETSEEGAAYDGLDEDKRAPSRFSHSFVGKRNYRANKLNRRGPGFAHSFVGKRSEDESGEGIDLDRRRVGFSHNFIGKRDPAYEVEDAGPTSSDGHFINKRFVHSRNKRSAEPSFDQASTDEEDIPLDERSIPRFGHAFVGKRAPAFSHSFVGKRRPGYSHSFIGKRAPSFSHSFVGKRPSGFSHSFVGKRGPGFSHSFVGKRGPGFSHSFVGKRGPGFSHSFVGKRYDDSESIDSDILPEELYESDKRAPGFSHAFIGKRESGDLSLPGQDVDKRAPAFSHAFVGKRDFTDFNSDDVEKRKMGFSHSFVGKRDDLDEVEKRKLGFSHSFVGKRDDLDEIEKRKVGFSHSFVGKRADQQLESSEVQRYSDLIDANLGHEGEQTLPSLESKEVNSKDSSSS